MTAIDRTAYPRFKRVVSSKELAEAFTPSEGEVAWARSKVRSEAPDQVVALLVWLKAHARLGYFPKLDAVPQLVVEHVAAAIGADADVVARVAAVRTAKRYREYVREFLGVRYESAIVRKIAEEAVREAVTKKDNPADLINVALDELVRQGCELPGYTTLDAMVASIRTEVNGGLQATAYGRMAWESRGRLERLLVVDPATRRSEFDRLKDPAPAATVSKFRARLARLQVLDAIGPTEDWLAGVTAAKIAHFAGEARVADADDMRKTGEAKRFTLLACLVHQARIETRDDVVTMFCKRIAAVHKRGKDKLDELREAHRGETERLIGVLGKVVAGARDATTVTATGQGRPAGVARRQQQLGQSVLHTLEGEGGIEEVAAALEAVTAYHGNNYLPLLERFYLPHRPTLFDMAASLELVATSADRDVLDALDFVREARDRRAEWIPDVLHVERDGATVTVRAQVENFASHAWRKVLRDKHKPGMVARRHLEVCVFSHLAAELRSGGIAVVGADSYADFTAQLLPWEDCEPRLAEFCEQAGIPADPDELVAHFREQLADAAETTDAGFEANTDLRIVDGRPVLTPRRGGERSASAIALEQAIHQRLPERSLLDILTRAAYLTGWHRHLGPVSGSDPKIRGDRMGRYVLTAYAYGTNLGATEVARHMRGTVSAHEIFTAGNKHSTAGKVAKCSTDVINAFAELDVAGVWGDGKVVAVDGSQIDTWENNLLAETHIRYGGYGGIAYRHVSNTYIALFSRFVPCGTWEAIHIVDGLLNNDSTIDPDTIHADTQGQSLPVFGLAALLGFDLLPRIRNWADLNFYRPDEAAGYSHIDSLFGDDVIDWELITRHWQDLMRTTISIREGAVSSVTLLRRLGNHSRKNRLYRAFRELGRAIRTITLLRFLNDPQLREQITAITNKAEGFHKFSDWIMIGGILGHNDPDVHERIVKFNELAANCAIYSSALDITDAANTLAAEGHPVDFDDLATVTPYLTHTIRRMGDLVLDLAEPEQPQTRLDLEPKVLFRAGA
ncbi:Tn3 family transposase [Amycolatopsis speibonae]|uniref:Tn3 family transposase n=1 Tax=Amycolatopsis speibonae TaxID=1450224 RepID=A0ABV7P2P3_9PSEU